MENLNKLKKKRSQTYTLTILKKTFVKMFLLLSAVYIHIMDNRNFYYMRT